MYQVNYSKTTGYQFKSMRLHSYRQMEAALLH